ncbi:hypothetical protein D3K51_18210 [Salmonella enterica]|nr:hypothetical protein [Salmonella enterica]
MEYQMKNTVIAIAVALASGSVYAHSGGDTIIKGGWASYFNNEPKLDSEFKGNNEDSKKTSNGFALSLTQMATDNIGIELGYASGMTATYKGDRFAGVDIRHDRYQIKGAPITLTANYYFGDANSKFRPYIGAGVAYVNFKSPSVSSSYTANTPVNRMSPRLEWPSWDLDNGMNVYPGTETGGGIWGDGGTVGTPSTPDERPIAPPSTGTPGNGVGTPPADGGAGGNFVPDYGRTVSSVEDMKIDPAFGFAAKIGADYYVTENLMVTASVTYMNVETTIKWTENTKRVFNDGEEARHTSNRYSSNIKTDPVYAVVGIGYRF